MVPGFSLAIRKMRDDAIIDIASAPGIAEVWKKGVVVDGYDPNLYRRDCCGAWIACGKYGDTSNPYGWEVDYVVPKSMGGGEQLANLRPMNWRNKRSKGNDFPSYQSAVKADGNRNIESEEVFTVNEQLQSMLRNMYNYD